MTGPLDCVRVLEFAGIGPGPFAVMLLADLGADVVRIDRLANGPPPPPDPMMRGRRSIALDLKQPDDLGIARKLIDRSEILIEGHRPGVMERLGLGPAQAHATNPVLVYGRMTGWGQDGLLAQRAGHDINYLAITGALHALGTPEQLPRPPVNFLGDLGGGALFCALGCVAALVHACCVAALVHARATGQGQVVDASVVDGTSTFATMVLGLRGLGVWSRPPGGNVLDGGAPFYRVYTCADGLPLSIGPLEPQFYDELLRLSGVELSGSDDPIAPSRRLDPAYWSAGHERWEAVFRTRTREDWLARFADSDACVAPVLSWEEAQTYGPNVEREVFVESEGLSHVRPAPRFDRTRTVIGRPPPTPDQHRDEILAELD